MSKPNHPRMLAETEAEAVLRNIRVSPRKLNIVATSIRNLPAGRAIAELTFSKKRIAQDVKKLLQSAVANAENNHQLDVDRLVVTTAEVGRGIVMRRFQARGRGKAARVEKWFSHLRIVVAERDIVTKAEKRASSARGVSAAGRNRPVDAAGPIIEGAQA
ncbi:50S ribosomal protein L22 [Acidiphilium sp.]|uniref:50S ribosomal protein L22 n=1 Tax=Acidiphilium sp. TaxID=527 RepID=UPI003D06C99B